MGFVKRYYDYFILVFSIIISAILRIVVPFDMVFQNGKVIYNAADAYYHMRYIDLIIANYPQYQFSDSYLGTSFGIAPLWDLIIVWFGRLFNNVDVIAAYLPAVLGILTLIPIFIITKQIFNRKLISSLAVGFSAIISGLFYARTQLGAADHHALEILLVTLAMMWLVMLLTSKPVKLKIAYCFLALGTFVAYYYTWWTPAAICSVTIIALFIYLYVILNLWNSRKNWFRGLVGVPALVIVFVLLSHVGYFGHIGNLIRHAIPLSFSSTIGEGQPLLFSFSSVDGMFVDLSVIWGYFGILFIAMLIGLGMLIYRVVKHRNGQEILLLAWTIVILIMALISRRWSYYFAVNVCILSALGIFVIAKTFVRVNGIVKVKRLIFTCVIGVAFIVVPFVRNDVGMATNEYNYPSKGWQEISTFLKSELTEAQNLEYYGNQFLYNEGIIHTPYVLSWWDYGYFLCRESHMPVICHGGGKGHKEAAKLLLSDDVNIAQQLRERNIEYIVIDDLMAVEFFYSMVDYAEQDIGNYYTVSVDGDTVSRSMKYFNTLLARLYMYLPTEYPDGIELVFHSSKMVEINEWWRNGQPEGILITTPGVKVFKVTGEKDGY